MSEIFASVCFQKANDEQYEDIIKKQDLAYKYLEHLSKASKIINDQKALDALKLTLANALEIRTCELAARSLSYSFARVLIDLIEYMHEKLINCFSETDEINEAHKNLFMVTTCVCISILRSFTNSSIKFCTKFHEQNGVQVLLSYLKSDKLTKNYVRLSNTPLAQEFVLINGILRSSLGTLLNLSRVYEQYKEIWKESGAVRTLFAYSNKTKEINDNRIASYIAIANIVDDEEMDGFGEYEQVLPEIVKMISMCTKAIKENINLKRVKLQVDELSETTQEVCCVRVMDTEWHIVELLKAIYHMAVNDAIKYDIYFEQEMRTYLREIIYAGNYAEKEYALNLLWQLCFNDLVAMNLLNDEELLEYLKKLTDESKEVESEQSNNEKVRKSALGILWILKRKSTINFNSSLAFSAQMNRSLTLSHQDAPQSKTLRSKPAILNQIMISYNRFIKFSLFTN
jgi:hypothetical protein